MDTMKQKAESIILQQAGEQGVDVLQCKFVDRFVDSTGCKVKVMPYGANKCDYLSKTLSRMYQ